ncbi:MAG: hypothetical protein KFH98_04315 [Gemmatimonadetes bacterium]|nr:hypothetical protein [Gemmatimonadota bacterium]
MLLSYRMDSYRPHLRSWLIVAAVVVVVVLAFRGVRALLFTDPHGPLRGTITALRMEADSCRSEVDGYAARLRAYDARLDSMRTRVRELEALDRRGVPIDSFRIYMEAFTAYNDSVATWPPREDSVRVLDARCRVIAERHNVLADSLRNLVYPIPE